MEVIFGFETALDYWRRWARSRSEFPASRKGSWPRRLPGSREEIMLAAQSLGLQDGRIHVMAESEDARRRIDGVEIHVARLPLPRGAVRRISPSCSVVSPEFCLVQIAQHASFEDLLQIGFELCGSFSIDSATAEGFLPARKATCAKSLARWADSLGSRKGTRAVRRASRHIVDGTASPMEAVTALLLCLPYRMGGYGIPKPIANCRIDLTERSFSVAGAFWFDGEEDPDERHGSRDFRVCDLFWPGANVAVEYDGQAAHSSRRQRARDAQRRLSLEAHGISVITVTSGQLNNYARMEQVAKEVSRALGHRLQRRDLGLTEARARLRRELLRPRRLPEDGVR